ncbi:hypothetical protein AGABI1DRAFT_79407 [Agaricus bisporus var. burnettii JB137-S8]|uniref:Metallo-beta-lactamase domain-containing protein n=2 Tax=Agaricus bisporus var. burnettii TaxID=192524 RepID=K5XML4_AGABU|nr:uncharacterized protein AGABI1DRAFT_79407 [Agaricus bisporus var. burnettii JB137-S8]EKM75835.1 hypothetical protein AGABI1DRAFT_79407 [Agaricus bisporus var. burnettii JB137-S8]KAF7761445.1 hypothetical protein Agabi119p4_9437 [Agaricus bisporus var. burnettii]
MSETVIREVARNVWTFSRPFLRFGIIPFGGRSTAIRMKDGGVWVLASTPLDDGTKSTIDNLGPVRYIIGADSVHHLFLGQYKKAYPSAKLIAPEAALERLEDKSLQFDGVWGRDPPDTKYGFEDDVKACYFDGFQNKDVAFFHPESKTLIEADLLLNLPGNEQFSKTKTWRNSLFGPSVNPWSWMHAHIVWSLGKDKELMKRDVKTVASWDFERIIPCHGDVIEKRGKDAWETAYRFYLSKNQ